MELIRTSDKGKLEVLRGNLYFSDLNSKILAELITGMRLYGYEKNETVFWEGDESSGLHMIRRGSVRFFKISPQGQEPVIKVMAEDTKFNEVPVFDHQSNPVNVTAIECEIWVIDPELLRRCIGEYPELAQSVIHNLFINLRMLLGTVEEVSFYQVTNRLARLINRLPAEQLQGSKYDCLTQDELAARPGTVREVVARSLKELERSGAIDVQRGQIRVINDDRLVEWT
jgi:CRP-like cAMP-binding protein